MCARVVIASCVAEPFTHQATITLHGDRYGTIALPDIGAKCLVAYMAMVMTAETTGPGCDGVLAPATGMIPPQSTLGKATTTQWQRHFSFCPESSALVGTFPLVS